MALVDLARSYVAAQTALVEAAARFAAALWDLVDTSRPTGSWSDQRVGERLFVAVSTAQMASVEGAAQFVPRAVAEQNADSAPVAVLAPRSLAGVASDGRDLETLLLQPLIELEAELSRGLEAAQAQSQAGSSLETIVRTQVADAGRAATSTAMVAEPAVTGWVRMLTPPSCGRCAILAGRFYKLNADFKRHPRCDCGQCPSVEDRAGDLRTDPVLYFESLSEADQNRYFGKGRAEVIRLGGDMNAAVNARSPKSGLSTPGFTKSGRMMPAALIAAGGGDREATVELLKKYGYLK